MATQVIKEIKGFYYSQKYKTSIPLFNYISVNAKINNKNGSMDKHILGKQTKRNDGLDKYGRPKKSYWRGDLNEDQIKRIITSSIGKGKVYKMPDGSYRELIKYGMNVGKYVDVNGNSSPTQRFLIHYSSNGVHAYPCHPKKEA
ncbi:MAG: hypothetical protein IJF87_05970 [Erysipelotrichaceae bacterium]|nr:hypothetical protein [Erysipelotrichaceae bacterium]